MEHYLRIRDFVKMGKRVLYVKYRLRSEGLQAIARRGRRGFAP
jgi:hypothetical protein